MKKITIVTVLVALLAFNIVSAESPITTPAPQPNPQVQQFFKVFFDDTAEAPESLKPVQPYLKKYASLQTDLTTQQSKILKFITEVSNRNVSNKADVKAVLKEIDTLIKDLNTKRNAVTKYKATFDKQLSILIKDKNLLNAINQGIDVLDSKEFSNLEDAKYQYDLEFLYASKNFYTLLLNSSTQFTTVNGYMKFETGTMANEYWTYIASVRNTYKSLVQNELDGAVLMKKYCSFILETTMCSTLIQNLDAATAVDNQLKDLWVKTTPIVANTSNQGAVDNTVYTESELDKRLKQNADLQNIMQEIKISYKEYSDNGVYRRTLFDSKDKIKKALELSKSILALQKKYNKLFYPIYVNYLKDFPTSGNAITDSVRSSDEEFKAYYISYQDWANENESIEWDIKLYTLALANWGKFTVSQAQDIEYPFSFTNKSANTTYRKMLDGYNSRFDLLLKSAAAKQQPQA